MNPKDVYWKAVLYNALEYNLLGESKEKNGNYCYCCASWHVSPIDLYINNNYLLTSNEQDKEIEKIRIYFYSKNIYFQKMIEPLIKKYKEN